MPAAEPPAPPVKLPLEPGLSAWTGAGEEWKADKDTAVLTVKGGANPRLSATAQAQLPLTLSAEFESPVGKDVHGSYDVLLLLVDKASGQYLAASASVGTNIVGCQTLVPSEGLGKGANLATIKSKNLLVVAADAKNIAISFNGLPVYHRALPHDVAATAQWTPTLGVDNFSKDRLTVRFRNVTLKKEGPAPRRR
ncbi:MAG: hypothetical protein HYU66_17545 [Armatimonadetes bacterium]|nr:hypothetical protein [Armatimonadota bacterium]